MWKTKYSPWFNSIVPLLTAITWRNCFLYDFISLSHGWEGILDHSSCQGWRTGHKRRFGIKCKRVYLQPPSDYIQNMGGDTEAPKVHGVLRKGFHTCLPIHSPHATHYTPLHSSPLCKLIHIWEIEGKELRTWPGDLCTKGDERSKQGKAKGNTRWGWIRATLTWVVQCSSDEKNWAAALNSGGE